MRKESYSLICMTTCILQDVVHEEDCMNRAKIWYHKVKIYGGTSPVTKQAVPPDFFESQFIIMRMCDPLLSETMLLCLATGAAKHFVYFQLI